MAGVRIVAECCVARPVIHDGMSQPPERRLDAFFRIETTMVRADSDFHLRTPPNLRYLSIHEPAAGPNHNRWPLSDEVGFDRIRAVVRRCGEQVGQCIGQAAAAVAAENVKVLVQEQRPGMVPPRPASSLDR